MKNQLEKQKREIIQTSKSFNIKSQISSSLHDPRLAERILVTIRSMMMTIKFCGNVSNYNSDKETVQ